MRRSLNPTPQPLPLSSTLSFCGLRPSNPSSERFLLSTGLFPVLIVHIRTEPEADWSRHELPPVPAASEAPGAGVGPAFSDDVNTGKDLEEHPGSALERELEGKV